MTNDQYFHPSTCHSCHRSSCHAEWHEYNDNNRALVVWRCSDCGHVFETLEDGHARPLSQHELVHTFLPSLLVG